MYSEIIKYLNKKIDENYKKQILDILEIKLAPTTDFLQNFLIKTTYSNFDKMEDYNLLKNAIALDALFNALNSIYNENIMLISSTPNPKQSIVNITSSYVGNFLYKGFVKDSEYIKKYKVKINDHSSPISPEKNFKYITSLMLASLKINDTSSFKNTKQEEYLEYISPIHLALFLILYLRMNNLFTRKNNISKYEFDSIMKKSIYLK